MSAIDIIGIVVSGVTLLGTIIGGAMAWQKIKDQASELAKQNESTCERIEELEKRIDSHDKLVTKLAVLAERLDWIQKALRNRGGEGTRHHQRDDLQDT